MTCPRCRAVPVTGGDPNDLTCPGCGGSRSEFSVDAGEEDHLDEREVVTLRADKAKLLIDRGVEHYDSTLYHDAGRCFFDASDVLESLMTKMDLLDEEKAEMTLLLDESGNQGEL